MVTNKSNIRSFTIKINEVELAQCDSYKYLGVIFDKNLSWQPHIEYICGKINKSIGGLAVLRHRTGLSVLREVFFALVYSYVRYGILAWG